jgi:hypothetical protein
MFILIGVFAVMICGLLATVIIQADSNRRLRLANVRLNDALDTTTDALKRSNAALEGLMDIRNGR